DGTCRLYDLIRAPEHTLLLLPGDADSAAAAEALALARAARAAYHPHLRAFVVTRGEVAGRDAPGGLLQDLSGALHARLGADRPSLFMVRPDGHLGLRAAPPSLEAIQGYLARILVT